MSDLDLEELIATRRLNGLNDNLYKENNSNNLDTEKEFLLIVIENLQEEIKRLKKINKNTIKIPCQFNEQIYEVDTQIKNDLTEMEYYYLADDYKNPTRVRFIEYEVLKGIEGFSIFADVLNLTNNEFELYNPKSLFKTADKAGNEFLNKKTM